MTKINRRQFVGTTAKAAAFSIVPGYVLGGRGRIAPSDKLNIACIGNGTQGTRVMLDLLKYPQLQIIAVADPVRQDDRYLNWGKYELRNRIREAIQEPAWDEGVEGCRAGREPAKRIVETWYGKQKGSPAYKGCRSFEDYREMLEKMPELDAVMVGTTDHQHAQASVRAMEKGKHVMCQKPMTNSVHEARVMAETARRTGVATQVLTANASAPSTDKLCEMIWTGAIGPVRQVHNWSTRPVWPSGFTSLPAEEPVPNGFNWDLWLGPRDYRPFSYQYAHTIFRSWYDFGTGAIGDMGCYAFDVIFRALKLGFPDTIQASGSTYCDVINSIPTHLDNSIAHPRAMTAHFTFPEREGMPPVELFWYDGGMRPLVPEELEKDGKGLPAEGMLFIGDKGKILAEFHGGNPRLIPETANMAYQAPAPFIERSKDHIGDWIAACKGGKPGRSHFEFADPVTEALNLAVIAMRTRKKLRYEPSSMKTDSEEANKLIKPFYRQGYEL